MSYAKIHLPAYHPDGSVDGSFDVETSWYHTNLVFLRRVNGPGFYVSAGDLIAAVQEVQRQMAKPEAPVLRKVGGARPRKRKNIVKKAGEEA